MGFNAGGTNVGGVQSIEQGALTAQTANLSIDSAATHTQEWTVPAGHIWLLKAGQGYKSTGTYTVTLTQFIVDYDGTGTAAVTIGVGSTSLQYSLPQVITMPAGSKIKMSVTVTPWTSVGNFVGRIIYQDVTV